MVAPTPGPQAASEGAKPSDSRLLHQGLRFAVTGGAVALLYVSLTAGLAEIGVPFQLALAVAFGTALVAHFTMQRVFVWAHADGFALGARRQAGRYLTLAVVQYAVTALSTAVLPGALGVRTLFVYLGTVLVITCASFLFFRIRVFHPNVAPARPG